jgi:hypothetical protein
MTGEHPIPAGWKAHCDESGSNVNYNKTINQWAPSYEQMVKTFPVEAEGEPEVEILTQRSHSSSQDSHASRLSNAKKPFKKRQPGV